MQELYIKAGPCGLLIIALGCAAIFIATRGLILALLSLQQGSKPGSLLRQIVQQCRKAAPEQRAQLVSLLMQQELRGIFTAIYFLKLCAAIGPLLGLLGTVLGMVDVFSHLAEQQSMSQTAQLAAGIWQALLTTVMGLCLAIPAMVIHYILMLYLRRMRNNVSLQAALPDPQASGSVTAAAGKERSA